MVRLVEIYLAPNIGNKMGKLKNEELAEEVRGLISEGGFNLNSYMGCTLDRSWFVSIFNKKYPNTQVSWRDVCDVLMADGYLKYESNVDGYRVIKA